MTSSCISQPISWRITCSSAAAIAFGTFIRFLSSPQALATLLSREGRLRIARCFNAGNMGIGRESRRDDWNRQQATLIKPNSVPDVIQPSLRGLIKPWLTLPGIEMTDFSIYPFGIKTLSIASDFRFLVSKPAHKECVCGLVGSAAAAPGGMLWIGRTPG